MTLQQLEEARFPGLAWIFRSGRWLLTALAPRWLLLDDGWHLA